MNGLPFEQLPATTPESTITEQINSGRRQIQNKYALQWQEANRSARFLGPAKHQQMLRQIDTSAKQEMLQFNQRAQTQLDQLQRITMMGEQGLIANADQIKARMVFGADVAESMYPEPERGRSVALQFGELDIYGGRIDRELERFLVSEEKRPSLIRKAAGVMSPATMAYAALTRKPKRAKLQILDPSLPSGEKDKFGDPIMGAWRKATEEETQLYGMYREEKREIEREKKELLAIPGVGRRVVQPGTTGGSFGDKVAASVRKEAPRAPGPKVIRQRNRRTNQERISYDGGKTWQIVSG